MITSIWHCISLFPSPVTKNTACYIKSSCKRKPRRLLENIEVHYFTYALLNWYFMFCSSITIVSTTISFASSKLLGARQFPAKIKLNSIRRNHDQLLSHPATNFPAKIILLAWTPAVHIFTLGVDHLNFEGERWVIWHRHEFFNPFISMEVCFLRNVCMNDIFLFVRHAFFGSLYVTANVISFFWQ